MLVRPVQSHTVGVFPTFVFVCCFSMLCIQLFFASAPKKILVLSVSVVPVVVSSKSHLHDWCVEPCDKHCNPTTTMVAFINTFLIQKGATM